MKKKNWNISIFVLFILITSSLIWVIAIFFLKQLTQYSSSFYDYYKTYYISKAWLELSLSQAKNHWIWFEYTIDSWNTIFPWIFSCVHDCGFTTNIIWNSQYLNKAFWKWTWCDEESAFSITWWQSIVLPLFKFSWDGKIFTENNWTENIITNNNEYEQIKMQKCEDCNENLFQDQNFNFWIIGFSWWLQNWLFFQTGNDISQFFQKYLITIWNFLNNQIYYFIISNPDNYNKSFCIYTQNSYSYRRILYLPTQSFYIKSMGKYWDKMIWLEAVYKQPLPDFLINWAF